MKLKPLVIKDITAKIPIIQGGMGIGISCHRLASAVANEGGIGIISAAQTGYREVDFKSNTLEANLRALRDEIRKARENTKGIIGVNIMVAMKNYAQFVKVAVEEKVDLIISGAGLPLELPELTEGSNVKLVPIVSSLRAAELIMKRWMKKFSKRPDAIVVEGPEAGGHLGFNKEDLIENTCQDVYSIVNELSGYLKENQLDIPVIAAGGIFHAKDIVKAIEAGASGVQMATRFVATYECDASEAFKQAYIDAKKEDIVIMQSPVGLPGRALRNPMLDMVEGGERVKVKKCLSCVHKCDPATTPFCITDALINAAIGDLDHALLFVGSRVHEIDCIVSVKDIFEEISRDMEAL
ncbi:MAG: nitronate monooxygenase [Vallitaleaceae bacterium]|nr:nitronate monooxygenase [Vallitaleaceae bacterium]